MCWCSLLDREGGSWVVLQGEALPGTMTHLVEKDITMIVSWGNNDMTSTMMQ